MLINMPVSMYHSVLSRCQLDEKNSICPAKQPVPLSSNAKTSPEKQVLEKRADSWLTEVHVEVANKIKITAINVLTIRSLHIF